MLNDKQHIDDLFSDILHDYQEKVPVYSWKNIQESLKVEQKKRNIAYIKSIAALLALLLTFGLGYLTSDYKIKSKNRTSYIKLIDRSNQLIFNPLFAVKKGTINTVAKLSHTKQPENNINEIVAVVLPYDKYKEKEEIETNITKNIADTKENVSSQDKPNQLLTSRLLWKEESRYDNGSLLKSKQSLASHWSIGAKFSPIYRVKVNTDPVNINNLSQLKVNNHSTTEVLSSYSGGVNVSYRLSKRVSIESGLFYSASKQLSKVFSKSEYASSTNHSLDGKLQQTAAKTSIPDSYSSTVYTQNIDYLELPFLIKYRIIDRRFGLDFAGGMSTNFLVRNAISSDYEQHASLNNVNTTLYNANISLGMNYRLLKNIRFNIEPTLRYSINPNSFLSKYPYSFAIFAGVIYNLK